MEKKVESQDAGLGGSEYGITKSAKEGGGEGGVKGMLGW